MTNAVKGTVHLEAGGRMYTLALTTNALCALEDRLGQPFTEIFADIGSMGLVTFRAVMWAALIEHHALSETEAGALIDAVGMPIAAQAVFEAVQIAFPAPGESARPFGTGITPTHAGTGAIS